MAKKPEQKKRISIPGKFVRRTFDRIAKGNGLSDAEAKALFNLSVSNGAIVKAGMIGQLNDIEAWEQQRTI
jgi:hypothetical protein